MLIFFFETVHLITDEAQTPVSRLWHSQIVEVADKLKWLLCPTCYPHCSSPDDRAWPELVLLHIALALLHVALALLHITLALLHNSSHRLYFASPLLRIAFFSQFLYQLWHLKKPWQSVNWFNLSKKREIALMNIMYLCRKLKSMLSRDFWPGSQ